MGNGAVSRSRNDHERRRKSPEQLGPNCLPSTQARRFDGRDRHRGKLLIRGAATPLLGTTLRHAEARSVRPPSLKVGATPSHGLHERLRELRHESGTNADARHRDAQCETSVRVEAT